MISLDTKFFTLTKSAIAWESSIQRFNTWCLKVRFFVKVVPRNLIFVNLKYCFHLIYGWVIVSIS